MDTLLIKVKMMDVQKGMIVIGAEGLVGQVTSVDDRLGHSSITA